MSMLRSVVSVVAIACMVSASAPSTAYAKRGGGGHGGGGFARGGHGGGGGINGGAALGIGLGLGLLGAAIAAQQARQQRVVAPARVRHHRR